MCSVTKVAISFQATVANCFIKFPFSLFFSVILLHAATRKRNVKNKFANMVELFKEDVSLMTIILSKICSNEEENSEHR